MAYFTNSQGYLFLCSDYMAAAGIENYIKPQTWQKMICGEWMELYHFDENKNLICLNGKIASKCQNGNTHSRGRETAFYHIENCRRCNHRKLLGNDDR